MEIFLIPLFIISTLANLAVLRQVVLGIGYVGFTGIFVLGGIIAIGDYNAGDPATMESAYISLAEGMITWLALWWILSTIVSIWVVARKKDSLVREIIDEIREAFWSSRRNRNGAENSTATHTNVS